MPRFHTTSNGNVQFTIQEEELRDAEEIAFLNALPPIPREISPRQIRQALTASGLRDQVESAVAASPTDIKDWWEFSTSVERDNEHVTGMAAKLGVTDRQLDDLFTLAGTL